MRISLSDKLLPETPPGYRGTMTPMIVQFWAVKRQYPDALLFYRMGDFYEMFFDDALTAAPILGVQLTSRDKSSDTPIPMCGVPHHAAMNYLQKLVAAGHPVAVCEQMEPPGGKGILRREVVRVVTPGLVGDPDMVSAERGNVLFAIDCTDCGIAASAFDLLAQDLRAADGLSRDAFFDLLREERPAELLTTKKVANERWFAQVADELPGILVTVRDAYFSGTPTRALEQYLEETQKTRLGCFDRPRPLRDAENLRIDNTSASALEISESRSGAPTLWKVVDRTTTPMGRRLLKDWLLRPLTDRAAIEARQDAVAQLADRPSAARALSEALRPVGDLERLATKIQLGLASPRDLGAVGAMLGAIPSIAASLQQANSALFTRLADRLNPLTDVAEALAVKLVENPPANFRDGGIFRDEAHEELAKLRGLAGNSKTALAALEAEERARSGISSLKIKYSRVFGYTIEVTNAHLSKVPSDWKRKQTIAGGERFVTDKLASLEQQLASAEERAQSLEEALFLELRQQVTNCGSVLHENSRVLAEADALLGFGLWAAEKGLVRPKFNDGGTFRIVEGRHPVLEQLMPAGDFVPNSIDLTRGQCRTMLLTGPNMGGKSTYLRQTALLVILAQAGSFVPAQEAELPIVDAIFTRIGSGDDLARGRSTFLVEMCEVARIVEQATERSLVVIDEVGRGTSTYDGLALAWAILEHLHTEVRSRTLFATHFQELVRLEERHDELRNSHLLVQRWNDEIRFLHKVEAGAADRSYGVEVARLAGLPRPLLQRAQSLCGQLERAAPLREPSLASQEGEASQQLPLFATAVPSETPEPRGSAPN